MRIDLHNHTAYSPDSVNRLVDYEIAYREGRFDLIAVTDHRTTDGALRFRDSATFPMIVGQEVGTAEGEIIGLYIERTIPRGLSPDETIARIRDQGGLVYVPHPFLRGIRRALSLSVLLRLVPHIDIIEVNNGGIPVPWPNQRAAAFAREQGLLAGAGSDAHVPCEIGVAAINVSGLAAVPTTPEALLEALRQGELAIDRRPPLLRRVRERLALLRQLSKRRTTALR
jgi:predicted metal-dependent phosphoesterase TrpH